MDNLAREVDNKMLYTECMDDDSSLQEEDYLRHRWPEADIWPESGRVTEPRMEGPGICMSHAIPVFLPLPEGLRPRAQHHLAARVHVAPMAETIGVLGLA